MENSKKRAAFFLLLCMMVVVFAFRSPAAEQAQEDANPKINASEEVSIEAEEYILGMLQNILPALNMMGEEEIDVSIEDARKAGDRVWTAALESWKNTLRETGYLEGIAQVDIFRAEGGYIAHVHAAAQKRELEISVQFDQKSMEIRSISFNPVYSLKENLKRAAMNTALGMGTVFIVLIMISLLIGGFRYINRIENRLRYEKPQKEGEAKPEGEALGIAGTEQTKDEEEIDPNWELELVAVLTAAIAAYTGESTEGLRVKSIRREPRR